MRIVLDTNVVLSALLWRGTPYHLFQSLRPNYHVSLSGVERSVPQKVLDGDLDEFMAAMRRRTEEIPPL